MHPEHRALTNNYYPILAAIVVRDGYGCAHCGNISSLRVDHITPVRRSGVTDLENLQILCHRCNGIKGNAIADHRPGDRGKLGQEAPRYTAHGALIIRVRHWTNESGDTEYRYLDSEVLNFRAKERIRVLFTDGRVLNAHLRDVYPPDLQHLFKAQ